jgi:hypothetical protein
MMSNVSVMRLEGEPLAGLLRVLCVVELAQPESAWRLPVDPANGLGLQTARRLHRAACEQACRGRGTSEDAPFEAIGVDGLRVFLAALGYRCWEQGRVGRRADGIAVARFVAWERGGDAIVVYVVAGAALPIAEAQ